MAKDPTKPREIVRPMTTKGKKLTSRPGGAPPTPELPTNPKTQRRSELARLLWGDPEAKCADAQPLKPGSSSAPPTRPGATPPVAAVPLEQGRSLAGMEPSRKIEPSEPLQRRHTRRSCSLPGVFRVILPEKSFMPQQFVVRAIDISPGGARLETRQLTPELADLINKEKRFARLELVTPARNRLELSGRIVRATYRTNGLSDFGFQFDSEVAEVDQLFTMSSAADSTYVPANLEVVSPGLDDYPSTTHLTKYNFTGWAPDAQEVEVHYRARSVKVPVEKGRFEVEVPLMKDASNFLSFVAIRDKQQSIPTPACIMHRSDALGAGTIEFRSLVSSFEVEDDGKSLSLRLSGPPGRFIQALRRIEKSLQHATHVDLTLELRGEAKEAAEHLRLLAKD